LDRELLTDSLISSRSSNGLSMVRVVVMGSGVLVVAALVTRTVTTCIATALTGVMVVTSR
jgi:hypothetical protein